MKAVLAALVDQQQELDDLVAPLDETAWQRPSRCDGWTVADVVLHLAQTNEMGIASAQGRFEELLVELSQGMDAPASVDEGAGRMVERERGAPGADVFDRWRRSAAELRAALAACAPGDQVMWVAGELSARTLATTRLSETWIHTGDVAHGLGVTLAPSERLWHIARLAWRTLPYAFARAGEKLPGPVAFELESPSGEIWSFTPDEAPTTIIRGTAADLCEVAGQRAGAADTGLRGDGPAADRVLALVRTFA